MTPLVASAFVDVNVVMFVEMRSLYAMSDCSHCQSRPDESWSLSTPSELEESERTERAVRFRMIVDGTVLAPLHTGLLKRRLAILVSNVQSFKQTYFK